MAHDVHVDRRSGESSSHSRSSGHRERDRHHRSSGEERMRGERRVESRSSHGERRSHRTVREEKRKSRKRYMCEHLLYIPYPRERGPMGGATYIGPRLGSGLIFKVSVTHASFII